MEKVLRETVAQLDRVHLAKGGVIGLDGKVVKAAEVDLRKQLVALDSKEPDGPATCWLEDVESYSVPRSVVGLLVRWDTRFGLISKSLWGYLPLLQRLTLHFVSADDLIQSLRILGLQPHVQKNLTALEIAFTGTFTSHDESAAVAGHLSDLYFFDRLSLFSLSCSQDAFSSPVLENILRCVTNCESLSTFCLSLPCQMVAKGAPFETFVSRMAVKKRVLYGLDLQFSEVEPEILPSVFRCMALCHEFRLDVGIPDGHASDAAQMLSTTVGPLMALHFPLFKHVDEDLDDDWRGITEKQIAALPADVIPYVVRRRYLQKCMDQNAKRYYELGLTCLFHRFKPSGAFEHNSLIEILKAGFIQRLWGIAFSPPPSSSSCSRKRKLTQ